MKALLSLGISFQYVKSSIYVFYEHTTESHHKLLGKKTNKILNESYTVKRIHLLNERKIAGNYMVLGIY